jgi:hypothetical protein
VFSKLVPAALIALPLAACSTPGILPPNEPAHISKVQVSLAPNVSSERFAEMVQSRATRQAARFGNAGAPKELRILIKRHNYKNPAMSLLVGDANYAGGRVAVVDVASGRIQGEVDAGSFDNLAINGIAGAIMAATQDKQKVDERLADGFAKAALRHAYGSAVAERVFAQPEPAPEAAPEEPGAKPAPKAPSGGAPVASAKESRSAMARPAPSPVAR